MKVHFKRHLVNSSKRSKSIVEKAFEKFGTKIFKKRKQNQSNEDGLNDFRKKKIRSMWVFGFVSCLFSLGKTRFSVCRKDNNIGFYFVAVAVAVDQAVTMRFDQL